MSIDSGSPLSISDRDQCPYRSLSEREIRVLKLNPGEHDEELSGALEHVFLPTDRRLTKPRFEAISYAWGPSVKPFSIHMSQSGIIKLTESLEQALRHFRTKERPRYLWADAVCIDQDNVQERSQQVAIMAQIFKASIRVLAWLGRSHDPAMDNGVAKVTEAFYRLSCDPSNKDGFLYAARISEKLALDFGENSDGIKCITREPLRYIFVALGAIWSWLQRPWFGRLWVVQEFFSARELVFCTENFTLSKKALSAAVTAYQHNWWPPVRDVWDPYDYSLRLTFVEEMKLNNIAEDLVEKGVSEQSAADTILEKLVSYSLRKCADPRDRIFAIRNVLGLEHVADLQPNYNIEPWVLYRSLALHLLERRWRTYSPLVVLSLAGLGMSNGIGQCMSWAPNFHSFSSRTNAKANTYKRGMNHTLCFEEPRSIIYSYKHYSKYLMAAVQYLTPPSRAHALLVKGRIFARVTEMTTPPDIPSLLQSAAKIAATEYIYFEASQDWYDTWYHYFADVFQFAVHRFDLHQELLNFLAYPIKWSCDSHDRYAQLDACPEEFWDRYLQSRPNFCGRPTGSRNDFQRYLMFSLLECPLSRHRRGWKITTNDGRVDLAWLPGETQPGDSVCLFAGAIWPFVLRTAGGGYYQVVGDGHTYSTPLIEAVGGVYKSKTSGDGHIYDRASQQPELSGETLEGLAVYGNSATDIGGFGDGHIYDRHYRQPGSGGEIVKGLAESGDTATDIGGFDDGHIYTRPSSQPRSEGEIMEGLVEHGDTATDIGALGDRHIPSPSSQQLESEGKTLEGPAEYGYNATDTEWLDMWPEKPGSSIQESNTATSQGYGKETVQDLGDSDTESTSEQDSVDSDGFDLSWLIEFKRGEPLGFNMVGLCYDAYIAKMEYIALV